ncbi:YcaO-like family protein [Streptomyces griseorubiginosus]|uniref:YcaO-like family protein n=1 Tax=Streptomyces griseorubiginosus TaxID=67304 RepID=UPI0033A7FF32
MARCPPGRLTRGRQRPFTPQSRATVFRCPTARSRGVVNPSRPSSPVPRRPSSPVRRPPGFPGGRRTSSCPTRPDGRAVPGALPPGGDARPDQRPTRSGRWDPRAEDGHQQLYLDRRAGDRAMRWIGRGPLGSWDEVSPVPGDTLEVLCARGAAVGHEVLHADLTPPRAAAAGMHVVRVIVPGLVGTAPASFPYFGGRRIQDQGVTFGWRRTPLAPERLNTFPVPHA